MCTWASVWCWKDLQLPRYSHNHEEWICVDVYMYKALTQHIWDICEHMSVTWTCICGAGVLLGGVYSCFFFFFKCCKKLFMHHMLLYLVYITAWMVPTWSVFCACMHVLLYMSHVLIDPNGTQQDSHYAVVPFEGIDACMYVSCIYVHTNAWGVLSQFANCRRIASGLVSMYLHIMQMNRLRAHLHVLTYLIWCTHDCISGVLSWFAWCSCVSWGLGCVYIYASSIHLHTIKWAVLT